MCTLLRVTAKRNRRTLSDFLCQTGFPYCDNHDSNTPQERGPAKGKPYRYAGFQTWVSRGKFDDMPGQVAAAIRFLRRHRDELKRLRDDFETRAMTLDFGYDLRIDHKNVAVQGDFLPPALISLAGELGIGIEMTLYGVPERPKKMAEPAAAPSCCPARRRSNRKRGEAGRR